MSLQPESSKPESLKPLSLKPMYLNLPAGELRRRATAAAKLLDPCRLCPRRCEASRLQGEIGLCAIGDLPIIASCSPHFGEEPPLVGFHGSGTVFFTGCNLGCIFCQNYDISHQRVGQPLTADQLAAVFLKIQTIGCHNLNLVTPTHVVPQILEALAVAVDCGFSLPLVYNSSGYDPVEVLQLLNGIVDIYMPDVKSFAEDFCRMYLHAPDYPEVAQKAVLEMASQVGDFLKDDQGIARRGVLVRHLAMPERESDSLEILRFLSGEIPARLLVNVMGQYRPCYRAGEYDELDHRTSMDVVRRLQAYARQRGLDLVC